ncbi:MAG TPA: phenylalanine--tRNA ligase subunit beta, partial [Saprospiraceae bacterium]|nr:phenylalanine--tRNA ligase subunit beta [Saprospiraceae bacterium]
IASILTSLGLEVEGMEELETVKGGLKGVVVARVVECWKHPNADRLSLTKVDAGDGQLLQVVCGAPNVAAGQHVLLAKEGAELHPFNGDPFTIKKGKIRGEASEGMLCAEDELGLGPGHDGIMLLPENVEPGTPASEYLKLQSDTIFEIGLTPNRSDATSHLGVAKDLLAWYRVHRDPLKQLKSWELADLSQAKGALEIAVEVADPASCPRYSGICLSGITVGESPEWLKQGIRAMGLNPINNVVDVTNFVMYEMGQPLHAFDYDQIKDHQIRVRTLPEGTPFKTLDEVERKLSAKDLMICDGQNQPLCMAGVFGGIHSGVSKDTTRIFIESAHFDAGSVRRSSMSHNLRTQSARCFEKGSDPNATVTALQRAVFLLQQTCEAKPDSKLLDDYPAPIKPAIVELKVADAIRLSGLELDAETLKKVLFALDMELQDMQNGHLRVFVPTNKPDVTRPADLVEEISRVYGLDHIPVPEKIQISFPKNIASSYFLRKRMADWLSANGLNELQTLSLVRSGQCLQSGLWSEDVLVYIHNTSNVQLDAMKPSMCLGGLEAIQFNTNRQQADLAFYETGKDYMRVGGEIREKAKLGIWLTGQKHVAHWMEPKPAQQDLFQLKAHVEGLWKELALSAFVIETVNDPLFEYGLSYSLNNQVIARLGLLSGKLTAAFDLKKEVWYAE